VHMHEKKKKKKITNLRQRVSPLVISEVINTLLAWRPPSSAVPFFLPLFVSVATLPHAASLSLFRLYAHASLSLSLSFSPLLLLSLSSTSSV